MAVELWGLDFWECLLDKVCMSRGRKMSGVLAVKHVKLHKVSLRKLKA